MTHCGDCRFWDGTTYKPGLCTRIVFPTQSDLTVFGKATLSDPSSLLTTHDFGCLAGELQSANAKGLIT